MNYGRDLGPGVQSANIPWGVLFACMMNIGHAIRAIWIWTHWPFQVHLCAGRMKMPAREPLHVEKGFPRVKRL
jgi:hypothetical protein